MLMHLSTGGSSCRKKNPAGESQKPRVLEHGHTLPAAQTNSCQHASARSRGGGGEGSGRAPQPFRGSSPSPALAVALSSRSSAPLLLLLAPWTPGSLLVRSLTRYLGRWTPPPPRRSVSRLERKAESLLPLQASPDPPGESGMACGGKASSPAMLLMFTSLPLDFLT